MKKLLRITTVPISLDKLLTGQLRFMNSFYEVIAVSADEQALKKIGQQEKIAVFHLEMTRKITPFQDLRAVLKLYRYLKKEKPFIVHTHTPKAGIVGMLASKLAGVPNRLHTVAGLPLLETKGTKRRVLDFVEKLTYSCATKVYPNSFGLKEIILQNKYCHPKKLSVLANGSSNGINTTYFNPEVITVGDKEKLRESLNILKDDLVFIFVGRLVSDKGINELVEAFEAVHKVHFKTKLLLVGPFEPELDPLLPKTEVSLKNNPGIISVGYQQDVRPYFAISNILAFPSYREGFPNVVLQAGAMGLPCIVTNINGCNEIIENRKNGILVPAKNVQELERAMFEMATNELLRKNTQSRAREIILSKYEQKIIWDALLEEYRKFE